MRHLLAIPILALLLVMSTAHSAHAYDHGDTDEISDTTGGVLLAQASPSVPAAGSPPAVAIAKPADAKSVAIAKRPSALESLRLEFDKAKKAWDAWRDKDDGHKDSDDFWAVLLGGLALALFLGDKVLAWNRRRTNE